MHIMPFMYIKILKLCMGWWHPYPDKLEGGSIQSWQNTDAKLTYLGERSK